MVYTQAVILAAFHDYYTTLYMELTQDRGEHIRHMLITDTIAQITDEERATRDAPLTTAEIKSAIHRLAKNKAPGHDGFPIEFYSIFSQELVPQLDTVI